MSSAQGTGSRHLTGFVIAVAVIMTAWILVRTWHGPRIHGDAITYVRVAENFADGKGLRRLGSFWNSDHPPGWPLVLAGFELLGISARAAVRWLNPILFGTTILFAGMWLRIVCRSQAIVVVGVLAIGLSPIWHKLAAGYYSEPLFLLLTLISLVMLSRFLQDTPPPPRRDLWILFAAGAFAGAAAATRYLGVVAIFSGVLVVLFAARDMHPGKTRLLLAGFFGLVASLPIAIVMFFNYVHSGHVLGDRSSKGSGNSLLDSIEQLVRLQKQSQFGIAWVCILAALLALLFGRPRHGLKWLIPDRTLPFAAFTIAYTVALVATQSFTNDQIIPRLFLPAAMAFLFVGCELLDNALGYTHSKMIEARGENSLLLGAATALALVLALSISLMNNMLMNNINGTRDALSLGIPLGDYSGQDAAIRDSDLFDYLERHPINGTIYSNRPEPLYWLFGHLPVRYLPQYQGAVCVDWIKKAIQQKTMLLQQNTILRHIVWFAGPNPYEAMPRCDVPAIEAELPELRVVYRSEDGVIYRVDYSQ